MEMQQVRYFLALAGTLNFTRAAEECNVTQPALTRAIKQLEDELGGALIRREGRHSHLTELGERMRPLLRACYENALTAKSVAKAVAKGQAARFSLGVARSLDLSLLVPALTELTCAFPGLQLRLRRGSGEVMLAMLKSGDVDAAVAGPIESWDRLEVWPMFQESFEFIVDARHELATRNEPDLCVTLLRGERILVHSGAEASEAELMRAAGAGVDLGRAHEVDADHDLEALIVAGVGVGLAPASALKSPVLRHLPCSALGMARMVALYTVSGRPRSRELGVFMAMLRSADWSRTLSC